VAAASSSSCSQEQGRPRRPAGQTDGTGRGVEGRPAHLQAGDAIRLLLIFFIGMGMFNAISTFIDLILASKGYVAGGNEGGNVGAVMMSRWRFSGPLSSRWRPTG